MRKLPLIWFLFFISIYGYSQQTDSVKTKKVSVYPVPVFGYAPETRWYFGGVALFTAKLSGEPSTPYSTFDAEINYTQNKQLIISSGIDMHFHRNKLRLIAENGYFKFPEDYWGFGINTTEADKISYDANRVELDNSLLIKNRKGKYLGFRYRYHYMKITEADDPAFLNEMDNSISASGPGFRYVADSRDYALNATKGMYFSFSGLYFWKFLGNKNAFSRYEADARFYKSVFTDHVIALQAVGTAVFGTVPFRMTSMLGSENIMRGYYPGRYRDAYFAAAQGEYRLPVWKIFGVAAFAGCGTVFGDNASPSQVKLRPSYGGGLRIRIDKKENVNLRFDYALGYKSEGFYVAFGEAF